MAAEAESRRHAQRNHEVPVKRNETTTKHKIKNKKARIALGNAYLTSQRTNERSISNNHIT